MSAAKGAGADAGMGAALAYLAELEAHNDRAWFAETKAERTRALAAFDALVGSVSLEEGRTLISIAKPCGHVLNEGHT